MLGDGGAQDQAVGPPFPFSEGCTRPPGEPLSSLLGKTIGSSQKSGPFGDWPRAAPYAERPPRKEGSLEDTEGLLGGGEGKKARLPQMESQALSSGTGRGQAPPTSLQDAGHCWEAVVCLPLGGPWWRLGSAELWVQREWPRSPKFQDLQATSSHLAQP